MMKTKAIIFIAISIIISIFIFVGNFYVKQYHKEIKSNPKMYCYENFRKLNKPIPVLIIKDLKFKKQYLDYYYQLERGIEPYLSNNIKVKTLPQFEPVYILGFTKDSLMANVVSYYDRGIKRGGNFTKGWVYRKTLHKSSPNFDNESK